MVQNKALIFKEIPTSWPVVGVHLVVEAHSFDLDQTPPPGGIITKNLYCSIDPYMRGRMRDPKVPSYSPPYTLGKPITAFSLVQVLASNHSHYKKGDIIFGQFNVEEYSVAPKEVVDRELTGKVDHLPGISLSSLLSVLGLTGMTAYSALYEIGAPKKGETIFISSAAGAVGHIAGQIAKHEGLHVIGSVGDDQKLAFINQLGFDGGFNYKKEKAIIALQRLAPEGVDIYFDNVGGEQLEAAIDAMNNWGRISKYHYFSFSITKGGKKTNKVYP
jgi:NADPH-dependent curcumin reductase CurA